MLYFIKILFAFALVISISSCGGTKPRHLPDKTHLEKPTAKIENFAPAQREYTLSIAYHSAVDLSTERVDEILSDATKVLSESDGSDDFPANIVLHRGKISKFSQPSAIINNQEDFKRLKDLDANVVIVAEINWCGRILTNIIGCAPVPGDYMAVVRYTKNGEGILWAHEFGHNCGLPHRREEDQQSAVMAPTLYADNKRINEQEKHAFENKPQTLGAEAIAAQVFEPQTYRTNDIADSNHTSNLLPITEFIKQDFVHGIPIDQALKYGEEDIEPLITILQNPNQQQYWPNAVTVLGLIGGEKGATFLRNFLKDGKGKISFETYSAKKAALLSLGYAANQEKDTTITNFLIKGLSPEFWGKEQKIEWQAPHLLTEEKTYAQLSSLSALALALSGKDEAAKALREAKENSSLFEAIVNPVINEALKEHAKVQQLGLEQYSSQLHKHEQ